jgi:ferric-dicitrate binding protein FerR (iron transport regulator)
MTKELFDKYLHGACTQEEKEEVVQWLHQQDISAVDEVLQSRWQESGGEMPAAATRQLWQSLELGLPEAAPARGRLIRPWFRRLSVAAAVLLLAASILVWYRNQPNSTVAGAVALRQDTVAAPVEAWATVANETQPEKEITLPDGSVAVLQKHASLRYREGFESHQRRIVLHGTAYFKVAKDKQRPFSVQSGELITTAIGTAFRVTYNNPAAVVVQLYEGKVKVHQTTGKRVNDSAVYLLPGQQCRYTMTDQRMAVSRFGTAKDPGAVIAAARPEDVLKDTLLFSNKPLATVLQQLQQRYSTTIQYDHKEIADIYFTGTVVKTDSLQMVLRVIAQMNALQLSQQEGIYQLSKQPH